MNLSVFNFSLFSYYEGVTINLFLLLPVWIFFCIYAVFRKDMSLGLLGLGLFLLFIKEWVLSFGGRDLSFFQIIFWEIFFFYAFFWIIFKIYLECIIRERDYFFSDADFSKQPFINAIIRPYNIFTLKGGGVFTLTLLLSSIFILFTKSEAGQALAMFPFFFLMFVSIEKGFFYWDKDYAYLGSPWTQSRVLESFRIFYRILSLGFFGIFIIASTHFFGFVNFFNILPHILIVFSLIKILALLSLFSFLFQLIFCRVKIQKILKKNFTMNRNWAQNFFDQQNHSDLSIAQCLDSLLKKTKSEWIYFHEPNHSNPKQRLFVSDSMKKNRNASFFNFDSILTKLQNTLKKEQEFFFYRIDQHSFIFRKKLSDFLKSFPLKIHSCILYSFNCQGKTCGLFLVNSHFDIAFQSCQKNLLDEFTSRFSQKNLIEITETPLKQQNEPVMEQPSLEIEKEPQKGQPSSSGEKDTGGYGQETIVKKELELNDPSSQKREVGASSVQKRRTGSLFLSSKKKNDFIIKANLNHTYVQNSAKVTHSFHPAGNRKRDQITYMFNYLYSDRIQNCLCLISNIKSRGKLFVFNEIEQTPGLIAATNLNLLNLFYSYLTEKNVSTFVQEWSKGWQPFSRHDICRCLAIEFNPVNYRFSYYNAGIEHAYRYNPSQNIFSSLGIQRSQLPSQTKFSKKMPAFEPFQIKVSSNDLIIIFSKKLLSIRNQDKKEIDIQTLFDVVRKNYKEDVKIIFQKLEKIIQEFAYSEVETQQILFLAKILK